MCELLVIVADIPADADAVLDAMRFKRGMVATIMPDGYAWGAGDRNEKLFRIIKWPGVAPEDVHLTGVGPNDPTKLPQVRLMKFIDLDMRAMEMIPTKPAVEGIDITRVRL